MARGDALPARAVPDRQQAQLQKDFERIREKLEKLTGERGDTAKSLSAIRRSELRALPALQSSQVTAAPTAAEFNALQADVAAIFAVLARMSNTLGTASIPKV